MSHLSSSSVLTESHNLHWPAEFPTGIKYHVSWGHLPNKLLALKSLIQVLLLSLRAAYNFTVDKCHVATQKVVRNR